MGTRRELEVEERKCPGTSQRIIVVGRKTQDGRRRQRVTRNHSRNTRFPSETIASCGGPEPGDRRQVIRSGRAEERQRSARNTKRVVDTM